MLPIRFSVRFLLFATLAILPSLWLLRFAKEPPAIVRRIESLGGEVNRRAPWWAPAERFCGRFRGVETVLGVIVENDKLNDSDLMSISKLRSVSYVTVMSNNVTDDGLTAVCSLPKLVGLALRCPAITDKGLAIAKSRELDYLYVESDGVTGSFLKPLRPAFLPAANELDESSRWGKSSAWAPSKSKLETVIIHSRAFGDDGGMEISLLPLLRTVNLSGCSISDDALGQFARAKALKSLDVSNTRVSAAALDRFREFRPDVTVFASH